MKILTIFGTRPEAIKLAPILRKLRQTADDIDSVVCVTGQHREMLDQIMAIFGIHADYDLDIMTDGQDLFDVSVRALEGLKPILENERPDAVVVQGDTTSACFATLASFYLKIPVAHVEAGLRTGNPYDPFPEEMNRTIISQVAQLHFAPTSAAADNLLTAGVPRDRVHVTGNPVVDAVRWMVGSEPQTSAEIMQRLEPNNSRLIVLTTHRRESFGGPMREVLSAIGEVVSRRPDVTLLFPVHLNPNVRAAVAETLHEDPRVILTEPLAYDQFLHLMKRAYLLVTDSGGIQEEAAALGKPVLVVRDTTERMESVRTGTSKLVGRRRTDVIAAIERMLDDDQEYRRMAAAPCPYGDGHASERIIDLLRSLKRDNR